MCSFSDLMAAGASARRFGAGRRPELRRMTTPGEEPDARGEPTKGAGPRQSATARRIAAGPTLVAFPARAVTSKPERPA